MDEKLKHSYNLNSIFDWGYAEPMRIEFSTTDPIIFDRARGALLTLISEAEYNQITLQNETKKGQHE